MDSAGSNTSNTVSPWSRIPHYFSSIRIWESLFALPFAYIGMVLASQSANGQVWPGWHSFLWITIAMFGARTLGMSANRLIHAREDSINPRTQTRHIPSGLLRAWEVAAMAVVGLLILFVAAAQLNPLALLLSPVAAAYVVFYSYAKYFTWLCNFCLGWALAIAPTAAWIGVTGQLSYEPLLISFAVAMWAGGFDVIYGCTDYEFDRSYGTRSVPSRIGIAESLWVARLMHTLSISALLLLGILMQLSWPYYIGWVIAALLLIYENRQVKPNDLSRIGAVFFRVNGYVSVQLMAFTILALVI
ncbi:MAG: 4-hydroxybenzoate octaprenyltransferase [Chloroflexi bacterium]|nr:4-hydroxybenzoate octaprenyltransferase [Chloroflexota bacterium]